MEADLRTWVSDKLMSLSGYSVPTVVQYVIGSSKKASSPSDIVVNLVNVVNLPDNATTRAFAEEIFARLPRETSETNAIPETGTRSSNASSKA